MSSTEFLGTDRFTVRRRLGAGGMGVVYEAYDKLWEQTVALKTLVRTDPSAIYHLKAEFRSLADVAHPNLISLHELFIENDVCFFTMEFVDGVDFIQHAATTSVPPADAPTLPVTEAHEWPPHGEWPQQARVGAVAAVSPSRGMRATVSANWESLRTALRQLADGLCALHEANKLHRDIKPSNVMVTKQGRVVILDFGLTTELAAPSVLHTLRLAGTPAYMSPEQALEQPLTRASDWYGVGATLYQCLTGELPFSDSDFVQLMLNKQSLEPVRPSEFVEGIPEDLESLCCDLLRRDPSTRPSGREVLERLGSGPVTVPLLSGRAINGEHAPRFIGREQHLCELKDAFAASKAGQTLRVYIHGRSGMGKSALVRRFLDDLQRHEKVTVLEGRCYERESVPYKALDGIIDSLSRRLRSMPGHEAAGLMPRDVHALSRLFPAMLRVKAVAEAPYPFEKIPDPLILRSRACAALRELFARMFERQPLVLSVDDLQWADADSTALLEDLLRPPGAPPLLLLVNFRSEEAQSTPFLRTFLERADRESCRELDVGPLTAPESSKLVETMLKSEQFVPDIVREGAGNPFFLEQLARWSTANRDTTAATLKISLDEMLKVRINPLSTSARALLDVLAVAGAPLDAEVACQAAGIGEGTRPLIATLQLAHLIRTTGVTHRLEMYHDRIREHVGASISADTAGQIHRNLAKALESRGRDDPEAMFDHSFRGGEMERAAGYAVLAAKKSAEALAFDRAAMFYRHAIDLAVPEKPEVIGLKAELAEALANAGRPADAAKVYLDAAREADSPEALEFRRRAAQQLLVGGHIDAGLEVIRSVLASVGLRLANGPRRALYAFLMRRLQLRLRGLKFRERDLSEIPADQIRQIDICWAVALGLSMVDNIRSADFQTRNLLLALDAGEPYRIARAMAMEAGFAAIPGKSGMKSASGYLKLAETLSRKVNHPHAIGLTTLLGGVCAFLVGKWREAARLSDQAQEILREKCTSVVWELTSADGFRLGSLMYLGEYAAICRSFPALLAAAEERGNLYASTELRTRMNFVWLVQDNPERARKELTEAMQSWSHEGFHRQHYNHLLAQAQIELYCGNGTAARDLVARLWPELKRALLLRIQVLRLEALFLKARTILASEERRYPNREQLRAVEAIARRMAGERMPWSDPMALLLRAGAANLAGDRTSAGSLLVRATEGFEAADMHLLAAVARRQNGQVAEAEAWMRAQSISNPASFARMWAPGFVEPIVTR